MLSKKKPGIPPSKRRERGLREAVESLEAPRRAPRGRGDASLGAEPQPRGTARGRRERGETLGAEGRGRTLGAPARSAERRGTLQPEALSLLRCLCSIEYHRLFFLFPKKKKIVKVSRGAEARGRRPQVLLWQRSRPQVLLWHRRRPQVLLCRHRRRPHVVLCRGAGPKWCCADTG